MIRKIKIFCSAFIILLLFLLNDSVLTQEKDTPPLKFNKKINITLNNPLNTDRFNAPVIITVSEICSKVHDFNPAACCLKFNSGNIEPLDIPFQICRGKNGDEIVFTVDLLKKEKKSITLQYNPEGEIILDFPPKTQAFEKWYSDGSNIAWENELIAYRAYSGIVDFFGKTYPHLRLQNLAPDSYHHERFWGIDPFVVGKRPGLAGLVLLKEGKTINLYGNNKDNLYTHKMAYSGPISAKTSVAISISGKTIAESDYRLFANRYENYVETSFSDLKVTPSVGMQKFDGGKVHFG